MRLKWNMGSQTGEFSGEFDRFRVILTLLRKECRNGQESGNCRVQDSGLGLRVGNGGLEKKNGILHGSIHRVRGLGL